MAGATLPERVAQVYYSYGLFSSSYPAVAITLAFSLVLLCCYPLLNVPLPGNIPTVVSVPHKAIPTNYTYFNLKDILSIVRNEAISLNMEGHQLNLSTLLNESMKLTFPWSKEKPSLFVQQIILKTGVSPWTDNLGIWDAFRAPLHEVYRLLDIIRNHEDPESGKTLSNICYHIENVKRNKCNDKCHIFPEYSCLILSPANIWTQSIQKFSLDSNILGTIFNYQNLQKGKVSISEMAFGMTLKDAGIKRYPLRSRPRALQYAVTLFLNEMDESFLKSLKEKLLNTYPLYQEQNKNNYDQITLIYYPGKFNFHELIPLSISYIGLFIYVYFSVRKLTFVHSKFGLAFCAVVTIIGSLSMSAGLCFLFGLSLSLQGKEIFPYLVILVGLENVLVLTKSVTSTDSQLDVKIRLAQGLSREGWSITKNLLTEITILTIGLLTFVPMIQEFSIFMIISLLSDFFMQILFFATILGLDVKRMDMEQYSKLKLKDCFNFNRVSRYTNYELQDTYHEDNIIQKISRSRSQPKLNSFNIIPTDIVAKRQNNIKPDKVPKRIRLVNIWARTRFFQRAFMVWMVVWISMIIYNSGILEHFVETSDSPSDKLLKEYNDSPTEFTNGVTAYSFDHLAPFRVNSDREVIQNIKINSSTSEVISLKHTNHIQPWKRVSSYHWSSILSYYNTSLAGKYITILPPILLSYRIHSNVAVSMRNADERGPPPLQWQALAAALDPIDIITEYEASEQGKAYWGKSELPIYPTTPMEVLLLAILCVISVTVITYMLVILYRCICTKNYAEWRSSWYDNDEEIKFKNQPVIQLVMEAVPIIVAGHGHDVECIATDGELIVSTCLEGHIKLWDSQTGNLINTIKRQKIKDENTIGSSNNLSVEDNDSGLVFTIGNPEPHQVNNNDYNDVSVVPDIRKELISHLSNYKKLDKDSLRNYKSIKYQFDKYYRELYLQEPISTNDIDKCLESDAKTTETYFNPKSFRKKSFSSDICNFDTNSNSNLIILEDKKPFNDQMNNLSNRMIKTSVDIGSVYLSENYLNEFSYASPIWCIDFANNLLVLGCADGHLEFWEASSGKFLCESTELCTASEKGITHVCLLNDGRTVVAASLSGHLLLSRLQSTNYGKKNLSKVYRRNHIRTGSVGSLNYTCNDAHNIDNNQQATIGNTDKDDCTCEKLTVIKAHQQPITVLQTEEGRLVTGSHDHTLKVFGAYDLSALFTLHGHCGPITSCFIDNVTPTICGSGSQDGLLCVWDLHTGACAYSLQAHDGAVTTLSCSASYILSVGIDRRICVWDRFQGHALNTIYIGATCISSILPLTHNLLLIGDKNCLTVYNISTGDVIRRIFLDKNDGCVFVKQILPLKDAIVCDYANQLRIIRFPLVSKINDNKTE